MGHILIVDDDPDIVEVTSVLLEEAGHRVRSARNGAEALTRIAEERPDLILLDLMMPVMDGWTFSERLRKLPLPLASIPVLVLSADRGVAEKAALIKAQDHIAKPFDLDVLLRKVDALLHRAPPPGSGSGPGNPLAFSILEALESLFPAPLPTIS